MPVGHPLVLHEDEIPYLYHVRVGLVDQLASAQPRRGLFFRSAYIYMYLGARAAGTGVAHFPEVVVLVAEQNVILRKMLEPGFARLGVQGRAVLRAAFEDGRVQQAAVDFIDFRQEFPGPVYGLVLEVVAEAPVAQHLEHSVVVRIVSHFFEVVVLSAHSQAFLRVRRTRVRRGGVTEEDVLELVHTGVGEHQRRVILDHHRGRRHDGVSLGCEEIEKSLSYFLRSHNSAKYQTNCKNNQ